MTTEELEVMPEPFLTRQKLVAMRGPKLTRLRIEMLTPMLQRSLLEQLSLFQQTDALLAAWKKVGWREDLGDAWEQCLFAAAQDGQRDVVACLVQLRGLPLDHEEIHLNVRLILLQGQPEEYLQLIETVALRGIKAPTNLEYIDLAYALMEGRLPGLGTLVARGAAAIASPMEAELLFDAIVKVRDRLDLPPEDPGEWMLDRLYDLPEEMDEKTREELAAARRQMDAAAAEAGRLRNQLTEVRAQLERQERLAGRKPMVPAIPAVPEPSAAELRKRIEELKTALKERHTERNSLRRELNEVLKETTELREANAHRDSATCLPSEPDREEQALLAEETTALQPLRLPVFPARFSQTLAAFPEHVGCGVMALIGRLAAGEPAAFVGMRRLRLRHEIVRVRVAGSYQLLFKLHADKLEILDLINRRDFEKWLKLLD